jgi:hypothetical protein
MTIPNLHDRRAIEEIVARMDTGAIAQSLDKGELSAFAREVTAAELTRRVLVDVHDFRARSRLCPWSGTASGWRCAWGAWL